MNTQPSSALTPFEASIRGLEARCGVVPAGWQWVFNEALAKLLAAQCPARAHVVLRGPHVLDIRLQVEHEGPDRVVAGILRKLQQSTSQTCEICARPGRLRSLGRSVRVLCGSCSGPRFAAFAVARLIDALDASVRSAQDTTIWWDDVPQELRPVLPASAWRVTGVVGAAAPTYATTHSLLRRHGPWLQAIRRLLDEAVELQESS